MRFYFIVLLTSSPFMASCDRNNGSKLTTAPHVFSMNPADVNITTGAVERMRLAVNGTADQIQEERTGPSSSAVAAVHALESKWKKIPATFPIGESTELKRAKELKSLLSNEMTTEEHGRKSIPSFFYEHSKYYDDIASWLFALGQLKHSPPEGVDPLVPKTFHRTYLTGLVRQGYTPLKLLSELNKKWVPSRSVIRNLNDFTDSYNFLNEADIDILDTLKEYVGNDYDLALVMLHLKRHGGILEENLFGRLAAYYAKNYRPDDLFELLRPKNGESEWNFEMLYYVFEQNIGFLLQFLVRKFGGIHELATILAKADESDILSKILLSKLVMSL